MMALQKRTDKNLSHEYGLMGWYKFSLLYFCIVLTAKYSAGYWGFKHLEQELFNVYIVSLSQDEKDLQICYTTNVNILITTELYT